MRAVRMPAKNSRHYVLRKPLPMSTDEVAEKKAIHARLCRYAEQHGPGWAAAVADRTPRDINCADVMEMRSARICSIRWWRAVGRALNMLEESV